MKKKLLIAIMCVAALVIGSIFGTMAYLTDTESVTNTFTVGRVGIDLFEHVPDAYGNATADITRTGNAYKLLPGGTYSKDPTVVVDEGSETAYVRMLVEVERIDLLKATFSAAKYYDAATGVFLLQTLCNWNPAGNWEFAGYTPNGNNGTYEFRYKTTQAGAKDGNKLDPLFTKIHVPGEDVTSVNIGNLASVKINVTAHAIQAAGFDTADLAWAAWKN